MANVAIGFGACWAIGTALMWRMLGDGLSSDSAAVRLGMAAAWPLILWQEGR